jgi:hypothetical protein
MFVDDSRFFYALCGIFLIARITFAAWFGTYHYAEDYIIAQNLANGDGYSLWRPHFGDRIRGGGLGGVYHNFGILQHLLPRVLLQNAI